MPVLCLEAKVQGVPPYLRDSPMPDQYLGTEDQCVPSYPRDVLGLYHQPTNTIKMQQCNWRIRILNLHYRLEQKQRNYEALNVVKNWVEPSLSNLFSFEAKVLLKEYEGRVN